MRNMPLNILIYFLQTYAPFFNNRGAVNLKIGNYHATLSDCSAALDLLHPPCDANAAQRAKAHLRRAKALDALDLPDKAMGEYEAAAKALPDNESVQNELECARQQQKQARNNNA